MIQYRVFQNDIEGGLGLALSHPLFYIIAIAAKYIPFGAFAFKVNMISAFAAAVTVANLFLFLRIWLKDGFAAIVGAVTLAVSHTFWGHGSIAETYTLYTAFLSAELVMLAFYFNERKIKYLYWLVVFNGLSVSVHMLGSIALACYAFFFLVLLVKKQLKFQHLVLMIVLWIIAAGPYEYLIVKNIVLTGDIKAVLMSAAFGDSWAKDVLNTTITPTIIKQNIMFFGLNFPTPNILFFFAGIFLVNKMACCRSFKNILFGLLLLFLIFASRYTIVDRYAFFIPFYVMVSVFIAAGVKMVADKIKGKALLTLIFVCCFIPVPVYAVLPEIAKAVDLKIGTKRVLPYRDDYKFFLQPWQTGYRGAERFANEALDQVEKDAIIFADGTTVYPLLLTQKITGKRKDVTILSNHGRIDSLKKMDKNTIGEKILAASAYVVSPIEGYCPGFILENYDFVEAGVLFRVLERVE
ncbi:MAG TPA: DUF2723 domain-containing protein [Sedimentisphaerales bacterium]|nr:DUF2723 domain-containing protein [Sedimentisphaerales bacterium]